MSNLSVLPTSASRLPLQQNLMDGPKFHLANTSEVAPQEVYGPQPPQPYGPALPGGNTIIPVPPEEAHLVPPAEYGPILEKEVQRFLVENPQYGPLEPENPSALDAFLRVAPTSFFAGLTSPVLTVVQTFSIGGEGQVAPSGVYYYLPSGAKLLPNSAFPISIGNSNHSGVSGSLTSGIGGSITLVPQIGLGAYANSAVGTTGIIPTASGEIETPGGMMPIPAGEISSAQGRDPQISINVGLSVHPMKVIAQLLQPAARLAGQGHWTDALQNSPVQITIGPNWNMTITPNIVDGKHDGTYLVKVRNEPIIGRARFDDLNAFTQVIGAAIEAKKVAEQSRDEVLGMISGNIGSGGRDAHISPFFLVANNGNLDLGDPALRIARNIRIASVDLGTSILDQLSQASREIIQRGGPQNEGEAALVLGELHATLPEQRRRELEFRVRTPHVDAHFGFEWLARANYEALANHNEPGFQEQQDVLQFFNMTDPVDFSYLDTGARYEPARPPAANAWVSSAQESGGAGEVLAQQFASDVSAAIRNAALPLASHLLNKEIWEIVKSGPANMDEASTAIGAIAGMLPDDERQLFLSQLRNPYSIDFRQPTIRADNAQIPKPDGMSNAEWNDLRNQLGIRDLDSGIAQNDLQGLSALSGDERIAGAVRLAVGIAESGLTAHQMAAQLREVLDQLSESEVAQVWPSVAAIARMSFSTAEYQKLLELLGQTSPSHGSNPDSAEVLVASSSPFDFLLGTPANDQLFPDTQAAWEFLSGVATETVGNVMGQIGAPPSTAFSDAARRVDDLMAFVGPLLPPEARNVIRVATAAAPVADGIASLDQKVSLAIAALNALPLGENFDTAIDFASLGLQMKQFFTNPDLTGGASLLANLIGRGVGPKTAATIGTVVRGIEFVAAPTPQNLAKFTWSAVNLAQMYEQVRIGMGETSVAGGAMADVTFMGHTNSRGPEYRYVLAGDQANLPALNRAVFDLIERPDGSFAFSGKGFRDPLSIDSDISGEMTTPGVIAGLDGILHLKRGPDNMHNDFLIDGDLARLLMEQNGGNTRFDVNANWSAFPEIEALFDRFQLDATYFEPAKGGMLSEFDLGDPLAVRTFPHLPGVEGYDDRIVAAFRQSGVTDHRFTFHDIESAAIFQAGGQGILSRIASDPALIAQFGPSRDIQGMIDFMFANPDLPAPEDPFDAFAYLAANPDLQEHFDERDVMGLSLHYLTAGHFEGRSRHAGEAETFRELERYLAFTVFDEDVYLALYPDVAEAVAGGQFADAREHFRAFGFDEGRLPNFNGQAYLAANPGLAEALAETGVTALQHYVMHGRAEGRPLAPPAPEIPEGYDEALYLQQNPDVAEAVKTGQIASGLEHFHLVGEAEGRAPGGAEIVPAAESLPEGFDAAAYMNQNPDILEAGIESGRPLDEFAIEHVTAFGKAEGRAYA
jgi:hypothetical protein